MRFRVYKGPAFAGRPGGMRETARREAANTMKLKELSAYALERYGIREERKWAEFPGFSVLRHPRTGRWVALLMRQRDAGGGPEDERCDLKCGAESLSRYRRDYLTASVRMHGPDWIGVAFREATEPEVVFALFDRAILSGDPQGVLIELDAPPAPDGEARRETALPFSGSAYAPRMEAIPERLRQMRRLFEYGLDSMMDKARRFCRQAGFMEFFEDSAPWTGELFRHFTTYQDLTTKQLRGYFSWRSRVRNGEFQPIPTSAAYLYLYELLNGVGASSPEDALRKMEAFEAGYLDAGYGDAGMRKNLRRWMLEYAVVQGLPPETARRCADPETLAWDRALSVLRMPAERTDEELFSALCQFEEKLAQSPVLAAKGERGRRLFCQAWRTGVAGYREGTKDLFTLCFGERGLYNWYPLANAVYWWRKPPEDVDYELDEARAYRCRNGVWQMWAYDRLTFDRDRLRGFLHRADLMLRREFRTGRYLWERPEEEWATPIFRQVIEDDRRAEAEAARPRITIDLDGLERIRRDAMQTRDSLLTEDELAEDADTPEVPGGAPEIPGGAAEAPVEPPPGVPLDAVQVQILGALLRGESPAELIRTHRLTPSLVADGINEALFDDFGDTVLACEDDRLSLMADYRDEIERMLGGN